MALVEQVKASAGVSNTNPGLALPASRNLKSGQGVFPPIPERSPAAGDFERIMLSDVATLYSFTIIHPNPKTGATPFTLIYADFPEGIRVFGRLDLADGEHVRIGMPVRVVPDVAAEAADGDGRSYRFVSGEELAQ